MIRSALEELAAHGVPFATRGEQPIDDPPPGGDVDILVAAADYARAAPVLEAAGFHRLRAPGHRGHRFHLAFDRARGRWLKLDITLVPDRLGWDLRARDDTSLRRFASHPSGATASPRLPERAWSAFGRRRPAGLRRPGPVVAVLGPDGAGKGTVIAALRREIPATVTARYLGHGEASRGEYVSRPRTAASAAGVRAAGRRAARVVLGLLSVERRESQYRLRRALRSALRTWAGYLYAWRGDIVICDRHPLELLAVDDDEPGPAAALERRAVLALVPWPDAVVLLDAPADVLYARKGEHSPERLEHWRARYQEVFAPRGATTVSTTGAVERVVAAVGEVLWDALRERRGW